jgi:hypothetical protein
MADALEAELYQLRPDLLQLVKQRDSAARILHSTDLTTRSRPESANLGWLAFAYQFPPITQSVVFPPLYGQLCGGAVP